MMIVHVLKTAENVAAVRVQRAVSPLRPCFKTVFPLHVPHVALFLCI